MRQTRFAIFIVLLIFLLWALSITVKAQSWRRPLFEKNDWIVYSSQFVAGASTGVREEVLYYPGKMLCECPWMCSQWWDSRVSWKNKYSEGTMLVPFSDANHFFKSTTLISNCVSVAFSFGDYSKIPKRDRWKYIAKKLILSYCANKAGFAMTYNFYFKNQLL